MVDVTNSSPRTAREPGGGPSEDNQAKVPKRGREMEGQKRGLEMGGGSGWEWRLGSKSGGRFSDEETSHLYPVPSSESQSFQEISSSAPRMRGGTQARASAETDELGSHCPSCESAEKLAEWVGNSGGKGITG